MSWLKKIFKKKVPREKPEVTRKVNGYNYYDINMCNFCKCPIMKEDKYTKQRGLYFHRKCWKQIVRDIKF